MMELNEVSFADITPLGEALKNSLGQNRYIHFSKQNDRFGINVNAFHNDPPGIYFYPVDWLYHHPDFHNHEQFATNFPYWIIAEIDFTTQGLDLASMTDESAKRLGAEMGWLKEYEKTLEGQYQNDTAAKRMWKVLQKLNQNSTVEKRTWLQSLKGMKWINDTTAIIHPREPQQLCVIDTRIMTIVERGTQTPLDKHHWEDFAYWRFLLPKVLSQLQDRIGGQIFWKDKFPMWELSQEGKKITIRWSNGYASKGLTISWNINGAIDDMFINARKMKDMSKEELLDDLLLRIEEINTRTGELEFEPMIPVEAAKKKIMDLFFNKVNPVCEIYNSSKFYRVEVEKRVGYPSVNYNLTLMSDTREIKYTCAIWFTYKGQSKTIMSMNSVPENQFKEQFWKQLAVYADEITKFGPGSRVYSRLPENYWEPFLGWLAVKTGLKILQPYEEEFYSAPQSDLRRQIARAFDMVDA